MTAPATRVLMTADPIGGVWTYALELVRSLPEVNFALCTMGALPRRDQRASLKKLGNVTLFASSFRLEWMDDPWADVDRAGEWLLTIASEFQPDLVHLNGYSQAPLKWKVPVLVVAHSCVLSWWQAVKRDALPLRFEVYRDRVAAGLRSADLVVAPSQAMLSTVRANYGGNFSGRLIYNGCHPDYFVSGRKEKRILAAGRGWDEAKNFTALAAVAENLPWPIFVAGGANSDANVRALGSLTRDEITREMARSAIFVAPALYEPFGLSILEAALSGCALVLGDIESLREIWDDCALFADPRDDNALAGGLQELIRDEPRRVDLAGRARRRAREFTASKTAAAYRNVYRECLVKRHRHLAA